MGVTITPDSHQRDGLAGAWWPSARLHDAASGQELAPLVDSRHFSSKAEADELALRLAKRRVRDSLHQG